MNHKSLITLLVICLPATLLYNCRPAFNKGVTSTTGDKNTRKYWMLENADMSGETVILAKQNSGMISKFRIRNFVLHTRIMTLSGAEGSVSFHTSPVEPAKGYAIVINNSDYRQGNPQKTGSLSLIRNNFVRMARDSVWFDMLVEVKANHILVSVNDKPVSEYTEPDNPFRIEELKQRIFSEGLIIIRKNNEKGSIIIQQIGIEQLPEDLPREQDVTAENDSITEMLNLLNQQGFPLIDFHAHLKGGLTVDEVCKHGRNMGYNYGIAPNCGLHFPVTDDSSLLTYYDGILDEPVFKAMQCEGREWITLFSPEAIIRYDYIFTDAMTWTDHKGRRMRLWIPEETFVNDSQNFMDMLVGKIEAILSNEPVDIYVNPTYLPEAIADQYDLLWTEERMDRVINALKKNDVALEINARFKIPGIAFIKKAKAAGVKFTCGTNNADNTDLNRLEYCLKMIREAGITPADMFLPKPEGQKTILKKGLPLKITG
jgi:hypothetical protein